MRKGKYRGTYETYRQKFQEAKRLGDLQKGARQYGKRQWSKFIQEGETNKSILADQSINKRAAHKAYDQYQKLIKKEKLKPGETFDLEKTYWGHGHKNKYWDPDEQKEKERLDETTQIGYHRTFKGFINDKNAIHMMIAYEMQQGERSRKAILDDYGYHD